MEKIQEDIFGATLSSISSRLIQTVKVILLRGMAPLSGRVKGFVILFDKRKS